MGSEMVAFREVAKLIRQVVNPEDVGDVQYIGLEHIEEGTLRLVGVGNAQNVTSTKFQFNKGDILFGKLRPYFRKVIRATFDGICSTDIWVVRSNEGFDQGYLYYWMASKDFVDFATQGSEGTKMPRANWEQVGRFLRPRLEKHQQRAIAHILGTLDDKIELNRKMNENLEAMARVIFKAWFVDFEPVRAKMEGRWQQGQSLPGLPAHLYDLFPDRLVDSELGEIPEGWEIKELGDCSVNFDSKRIPLSGRERANRKGPFPYYGAAGVLDNVDDYLFDGIYLLVGEDGSVVNESGLAVTQFVWGKFWVNNHAHVLQGKGAISTEQVYLSFIFEPVTSYVTGAVQPKLSQGRMNTMPFLFAGEELCRAFYDLINPWFTRLRSCVEESRTLAALRDALLPKLISGELSVKDIKHLSETST